ncbi:MAG: Uma2 family endonuclease, partial [Dolichospermum sp.]
MKNMQLTQKQYYTPEEYLELEATADYKSEYIEGKIIPIADASINHN